MPKFTDENFLNFSADDIDLDELKEDYKNAVKDDGCRIGDLYFYYQKGLFRVDVLRFDNILWIYPARAARKGKGGEQTYNDLGLLIVYTKEGERFEFTFKTPHKAENIFSFLVPSLQPHNVVCGMSQELLHGMEENGLEGFHEAMAKLQRQYADPSRRTVDTHHRTLQ